MYILPTVGSYIVNSNKIYIFFFLQIMGCARVFLKSGGDFWFFEVANVLLLKKLLMLQILEDNIKNSRVTDDVVR